MPKTSPSPTREKLVAHANAVHARHPQYKGYWDKHVLVTVQRRVRTKSGVAFQEAEVALAAPVIQTIFGQKVRSVYSVRQECGVLLEHDAVQDFPGFKPKTVSLLPAVGAPGLAATGLGRK